MILPFYHRHSTVCLNFEIYNKCSFIETVWGLVCILFDWCVDVVGWDWTCTQEVEHWLSGCGCLSYLSKLFIPLCLWHQTVWLVPIN